MAETQLVEAREAFDVTLADGRPFGVRPGDVFDSGDPVVQGREHLFGAVRVRSSVPASAPAVETADATPGTRRATTKPPAASKAKEAPADA